MTTTEITPAPPVGPADDAASPSTKVFTAQVFDEGEKVLDELYPDQRSRRDAVVELLRSNHDEITPDAVRVVLDAFGGADPDAALEMVVALYGPYGIDASFGEHDLELELAPAVLWSVATFYEDGEGHSIEHYPSREQRLDSLRGRAASLVGLEYPADFFDEADERKCLVAIERLLAPAGGRVHLVSARKEAASGIYRTGLAA